jgi:citrate synthase
MSTGSSEGEADFRDILRDAAMVRTPPWMALFAALAAVRPPTLAATLDWLAAHRASIEATFAEGSAAPLAVSRLPPELRYEPELGGLDRARNDHALRGRYLFADLVGKRTFFQVVVLAITGLDLSPSDAEMLEQLGIANIVVDQRAWPLAATRRVAARGGGFAAAVVAGKALMGAPIIGGAAAGACARSLIRIEEEVARGATVEEVVDGMLARHERIMGFGRPAVGPDERAPVMEAIARRYGHGEGPKVRLLRAVEAQLDRRRGLRSTAAAWAAAIMADLGMTPDGAHAVGNFYLTATVFAQAVFSAEQGERATPGADGGDGRAGS